MRRRCLAISPSEAPWRWRRAGGCPKGEERMRDRSSPHRYDHRGDNVGRMSEAHGRDRRRSADANYLDALAKRLAHDARLPLGLAVRRVQKLTVSARPPESYRKGGQ